MTLSIVFSAIAAISTSITTLVAIWIFFYSRKQMQFDILEQSFDVLQRINEKALESNSNVIAAMKSGNPEESTDAADALIVYFHYMRINRMFRAYEYWKGNFITTEQRDRIIVPHLGTLKPILEQLPIIMQRGYPKDFIEFLVTEVKKAKVPDLINLESIYPKS